MGWYFRRSQKIGPFRFNLSRSGVGASVGVRGFRVGVSAKGQTYVHAGAGGIYYRSNLGTVRQPKQNNSPILPPTSHGHTVTAGPMIEHGSAQEYLRTDDLITAIQSAAATVALLPIAVVCSLILLAALWYGLDLPAGWFVLLPVALVCGILIYLAYERDRKRILTLQFDLDESALPHWNALCDSISAIDRTTSLVMRGGAKVLNSKYHSGAGTLVDAKPLAVYRDRPLRFVKSNYDVPAIGPIPGVFYHFLPDRIICAKGSSIGAIDYSDLTLDCDTTNIIQDSAPPGAAICGHTWRYTNKDGGPDRRFNYNPQLPIVVYHVVRITSTGGMDHALLLTDKNAAQRLTKSLTKLADLRDVALTLLSISPNEVDEPDNPIPPKRSTSRGVTFESDGESRGPVDQDRNSGAFEVVLSALCCMMFADASGSERERRRIQDLMKRVRSPWTPEELERRMRMFGLSIKEHGITSVVRATEEQICKISDPRQKAALARCLTQVAEADGCVSAAERAVFKRFTEILQLEGSTSPRADK